MIELHHIERLAALEAKFQHLEDHMEGMSRKVDEMHRVLLQAQGFRMPFIVLGTVMISSVGALSAWLLTKFG